MIKEALQYVVGLSAPTLNNIDGATYSDKNLYKISNENYASEIKLSTLTSLVDYIKADVDEMNGEMIIHVVSPELVRMYSALDYNRKREYIAAVDVSIPYFRFGAWQDKEEFIIGLQSKFIDAADRGLILKFAGTVETGSVASYGDDGITQKASIKTGITSKSDAIVPNPVLLIPFRTFPEVKQPASNFIFRMRENHGHVECAIFEADGGAWKSEAMRYIKEYLKRELEGIPNYIIIS